MRVAILGGPGSGKGTQAKMLAERYRVPQISTGDLLRDALKTDQDLGEKVRQAMAGGRLVDDEVVLNLLEERLRMRDTKRGFIVDGYPRSIPQAQALDTLLGMLGKTLQIAINIEVDDNALVKRIVGRLLCEECGEIYNRYFSPPSHPDVCDRCSGALVSRVDDTVETVKVRIQVYHDETAPLITYYRAQHKLRTLSGMGDMDEIHQKLVDLVDLEIRPLEIKTLEIDPDSDEEEESTIIAGGQINKVVTETRSKKTKRKKKIIVSGKPAGKVRRKRRTKKKKTTTKKAAAKKTTAKKATARKTTAKKVSKRAPVSKKARASKKTASKKTTAKKTTKKNAAGKPSAKP